MTDETPTPAGPRERTSAPPATRATQLRELLMAMCRTRTLRDPLATLCEDLQLTPPQLHVVLWLGYEGPLTMGVLARRAGISEKGITGVMDRLEDMGFIERVRTPEDRRAVTARLTVTGRTLYHQVDEHIEAGLGKLLSLLEPADQEALLGVLGRLAQRMKAQHTPSV